MIEDMVGFPTEWLVLVVGLKQKLEIMDMMSMVRLIGDIEVIVGAIIVGP